MATIVYLVRHGETKWNKEAKIQGQLDIELNETGLDQASLLADRLARIQLDAVYSSNLVRAYTTAETIAASHNLKVIPMSELREINFGEWQGLTWKEIDIRYPGLQEEFRQNPQTTKAPGGESWPEVAERVMTGVNRIAELWPNGKVAVVSHGGASRMAICSILGIDLGRRWKIRMDNTGVTVLMHSKGDWSIECMNDTCHLDGDLSDGHHE